MNRNELVNELRRLAENRLTCVGCPVKNECTPLNCIVLNEAADSIEFDQVKHGKWLKRGDYGQCSLCGNGASTHLKFCSECGAKMDLTED